MEVFQFHRNHFFFIRRFNDGFGDGVGGINFGSRRQGQQFIPVHIPMDQDVPYFEFPFRNGAGFIHHRRFHFGNDFHHRAPFEEDTGLGSGTDTGKEGQGNGNDKGTGAGNDEEREGRINAFFPIPAKEEGRNEGHRQGNEDHHRRINPGEPGNEPVDFWLAGYRIFHGVQDTAYHGFGENLRYLQVKGAGHIDAARIHCHAFFSSNGLWLTGDSGCVDLGGPFQNDAIQGNPVSGADKEDIAYLSFFRRYSFCLAAVYDSLYHFRPQVHGFHDLTAALSAGQVLAIFADAVEEHDPHGFRVFPDTEGAEGGYGHKEGFIKEFAVGDILQGVPYDGPTKNDIGNEEENIAIEFWSPREVVKHHADGENHAANGEMNFFLLIEGFFLFIGPCFSLGCPYFFVDFRG